MPYYAERFLLLEVTTGQELWEIQVPLDSNLAVDDKVSVNIHPEQRHYFDSHSGERLT